MSGAGESCTIFDLRTAEVVETVDREFRYQGEVRHRPLSRKRHTVYCMACGWNTIEDYFMDAKAKGRAHVGR